jgi:hypothetical protein
MPRVCVTSWRAAGRKRWPIPRELGISSSELYQLARKGPHAADLLQKMLLALGA